jgi:hypothetical protein
MSALDWTPVLPWDRASEPRPMTWPVATDWHHAVAARPRRNGYPAVRPYRWRQGEELREREIADRLAAIREQLAGAEADSA